MARRTGLRTLTQLVVKMCQIFATFSTVLYAVVPADKHVYLDALDQACSDFNANVNTPQILGDEDA